ncbi:MAG TPA: retropepsin-like aspartic protease, partial [Pyrinomonadaceae bacterium]
METREEGIKPNPLARTEKIEKIEQNERQALTMQEPTNAAYTLDVVVKGKHVAGLLDTGATSNIMSEALADDLAVSVVTRSAPVRVLLGDGSIREVEREVRGLVLTVDDLLIPMDFLVLPGMGHSMLLGRAFVEQVALKADFPANRFTLCWHRDERTIRVNRGYKLRWEVEGRKIEERDAPVEVMQLLLPEDVSEHEDTAHREIIQWEERPGTDNEDVEMVALKGVFPTLFSTELGPMASQVPMGHSIETTGYPLKQRAYRVSPGEGQVIRDEV